MKEAISLFRRCLEQRRRLLGSKAPKTLITINALGILLDVIGDGGAESEGTQEAITLFREALAANLETNGADDLATLSTKNNLACALHHQGSELEEAQRLHREVLVSRRKVSAPVPPILTSRCHSAAPHPGPSSRTVL